MFPVQSSCRMLFPCSSRMIFSKCKNKIVQTLYQWNKTVSTTFHYVNENKMEDHNLFNNHHKRHLFLNHVMIKNKKCFKCLYSTTTINQDNICEDDKPTSKTPVSIRKDRMDGQVLFRSILFQKEGLPLTADDWNQIEQTFTEKLKENWKIFCMHTLYVDKNLMAGKSLISHLASQNIELNPVLLTFYIGLLGETANDSVDQENEMMNYFNILKSKLEVFDAASIEVLVSGISKTKYYMECLPLLEIYKEFNSFGPNIMCNLLEAGLKYKNVEIINMALSAFNFGDTDASQISFRIAQMVQTCLSASNETGFEMLMDFLRMHRLLVPKSGLENILELFNRYQPNQWRMRFGQIHSKRGVCSVCHTQMKEIDLSEAEFSSLQKAFLQQVIVGKNIFYKSTPGEVKNFIHFIKSRGPFDVVIDGLNVVHKGRGPPSKVRLDAALTYFLQQNKKVLLLGNTMIMKYLSKVKHPELLHVFLTATTKADDVFYLYAALYSGKDCLIVTSDKLRDHKFLLQKELRPAFHKWLQRMQIHHWNPVLEGGFSVTRRDIFDIGPVKDDDGWHIPVNDVEMMFPFGNLGVLCLRHKHGKPTDIVNSGQHYSKQTDNHAAPQQNQSDDNMTQGQYTLKLKQKNVNSQSIKYEKKQNCAKENNIKNDSKQEKKDTLEWFQM